MVIDYAGLDAIAMTSGVDRTQASEHMRKLNLGQVRSHQEAQRVKQIRG